MHIYSKKAWPAAAVALFSLSTLACLAATADLPDASLRAALADCPVKGGLILHLGCGDAKTTAALRLSDSFLVQGLDISPQKVATARQQLQAAGAYGNVSVQTWDGRRLPYIENLANLIVAEDLASAPPSEVLRVLAPNGVAYIKSGAVWTKVVKPRDAQLDEWTHYLHDAAGNAVSHDKLVGPPKHLQWVGSPAWTRHHDNMSSFNAMVGANGRVFYIMDEGPRAEIQLPSEWFVTARDGFNGAILWRRAIADWHTQMWPAKSGPAQLPRRIVAVDDTVYVTLGLMAPVTALDAATGKTLRTYEQTTATEEILVSGGTMFALANPDPTKRPWMTKAKHSTINELRSEVENWVWDGSPRMIVAAEAATGKICWTAKTPVVPLTLSVDAAHVVFHDGNKIVCLDKQTGQPVWTSKPVKRAAEIHSWFAPTLVLYKDVVLFSGAENMIRHEGSKGTMTALSAQTGAVLWTADHPPSGYDSPEDILVIDDLVWTAPLTNRRDTGIYTGRDVHTGQVKRTLASDYGEAMPHHRCHRGKATDRFLMPSRTGVEFVDVMSSGHWDRNDWVRGACLYGLMPANGLTYAPPQSCACYIVSKLYGLNALAPASVNRMYPREPRTSNDEALEKGPAFAEIANLKAETSNADWPTYRHDAARSGAASTTVPTELKRTWEVSLGGKLSSPVVAGGKLFLTAPDRHLVIALDAQTGAQQWQFTAGGRVDSPPTIWQGRVLFGAHDGFLYCLRASDGALLWRYQAAPANEQMMAFEQVESVWPLYGSVLVQDGLVHAVAGRSMFIDGGMRYLRLDAATGKRVSETVMDNRNPKTGKPLDEAVKWPNLPVALPDILSCDGRHVYMRSQVFDLNGERTDVVAKTNIMDQTGEEAHLYCNTGFLDDSWWHRSLWTYGKTVLSGAGWWYGAAYRTPTGRIMVFDDQKVYSFDRQPQYFRGSMAVEYHLFSSAKAPKIIGERAQPEPKAKAEPKGAKRRANQLAPTRPEYSWSYQTPAHARALVLAEKTLFMAGLPDVVDEEETLMNWETPKTRQLLADQSDAYAGKKGALLFAVSAENGKELAGYRLASLPLFDGMVAANGCLYLCTTDGKVMCLGSQGQPLEKANDAAFKPSEIAGVRGRNVAATTSSHPDFALLSQVTITPCELGWRVQSASGQVGFALKKLPAPLTKQATFKFKMHMIPRDKTADAPRNGFLVFGNSQKEAELIKCGLRRTQGMIVEGPYTGGKITGHNIPTKIDTTCEITVNVDLATRKVTLSAAGQTMEATLVKPLESIQYIGFCANSLSAEFSAVETEGK